MSYNPIKYNLGEYVRIIKEKNLFEKGYTPNWSDKIYITSSLILTRPPKYKLKELTNNGAKDVDGFWYTEELQSVDLPFDTLEIHKEYDNDKVLVSKLNSTEPDKTFLIDKNQS